MPTADTIHTINTEFYWCIIIYLFRLNVILMWPRSVIILIVLVCQYSTLSYLFRFYSQLIMCGIKQSINQINQSIKTCRDVDLCRSPTYLQLARVVWLMRWFWAVKHGNAGNMTLQSTISYSNNRTLQLELVSSVRICLFSWKSSLQLDLDSFQLEIIS
jgi:hypothetical protein